MDHAIVEKTRGAMLLDYLIEARGIKNDAEISRIIGVSAPTVSKMRTGLLDVSAGTILAVHERLDIPVSEIRQVIAS